METDSNKPKRGRPRTIHPRLENVLGKLWPASKTKRAINNRYHFGHAVDVLKDVAGMTWLIDQEKDVYRQTLLYELGRIGDPEEMIAAAEWLCEHKPTSKAAIAYMRQMRVTGMKAGNAKVLAIEIANTINAYQGRHQKLTERVVRDALKEAWNVWASGWPTDNLRERLKKKTY